MIVKYLIMFMYIFVNKYFVRKIYLNYLKYLIAEGCFCHCEICVNLVYQYMCICIFYLPFCFIAIWEGLGPIFWIFWGEGGGHFSWIKEVSFPCLTSKHFFLNHKAIFIKKQLNFGI